MGASGRLAARSGDTRCPRYLAKLWRLKAHQWRARFGAWYRSMLQKWGCIHRGEGAWDANTGNGYWGGLQMTLSFQKAHGMRFYHRWGTADRWPPWAQIVAAEDALRDDGGSYREWGTAHGCGLA